MPTPTSIASIKLKKTELKLDTGGTRLQIQTLNLRWDACHKFKASLGLYSETLGAGREKIKDRAFPGQIG